jgi:hypothetical protein
MNNPTDSTENDKHVLHSDGQLDAVASTSHSLQENASRRPAVSGARDADGRQSPNSVTASGKA